MAMRPVGGRLPDRIGPVRVLSGSLAAAAALAFTGTGVRRATTRRTAALEAGHRTVGARVGIRPPERRA
ncbi:hypothetical protein ACFPN6_14705 [Streptomyces fimbriatus]|uniref:Uncharacterized protein n=1 Tax=Streptomyces fimbriatus TaxID=68197 RepID=A0ABW0D8I4_STRFI